MTLGLLPVMITHHQLIQLSTTTVSFMATTASDYELNTFHQSKADIDTHIRLFWDDFPCPPPWRPSILTEVNVSKLGPQIGQSVKKFLVGKCQLQSVFPAIQLDPEWSKDDFDIPNSAGGDDRQATTTDQSWCDQTCELAIGLSGVFVAIVIVLIAIVCFNRSRRSHKMPSARPSRQQLQMSTSTSDPINWAEFSNTQVQFEDDMIHPPFRHRNLPSPPSQCHHPSCDPKWSCPNGSSFHPLMRVSPASTTYCTRGYTAVYEKIDDEDDEYYDDRVPCNHTRSCRRGERTMNIPPISYRPSNGVPFIPESHANSIARYREEETGFNGENFPVSVLPRYFELQDTHHNQNTQSSAFEDQMNLANNANRENDSLMASRMLNNSCCNGLPMHNTFLNNPNSMCNQLCATCVSNVVSTNSPPPCLTNHNRGQQEMVSNVNSFHCMPPISSTANGVSTHTHISGYRPPTTSSFRQFSNIPPPLDDSVEGIDPPPYSDPGCDLRCRNNSRLLEGAPLYENDNSDGRSPFTDLTQTQPAKKHVTGNHSRACHVTQKTSPVGSPCREWCPSCQQIPLLNGNLLSDDLHSACSVWPKTSNNNTPSEHAKTSSRRTRSSDDKVSVNDNDNEVDNILVDLNDENGAIRNTNENITRPHGQSQRHETNHRNQACGSGDGCGTRDENTTLDDDCYHGQEEWPSDGQSSQNVLSLHSYYFNKTS